MTRDCAFSRVLRARTKTRPDWEAEHRSHLVAPATFTWDSFKHPSGEWSWLVCPCGAKLLTFKEDS